MYKGTIYNIDEQATEKSSEVFTCTCACMTNKGVCVCIHVRLTKEEGTLKNQHIQVHKMKTKPKKNLVTTY